MAGPLLPGDIPASKIDQGLVRLFDTRDVAGRLKKIKKPACRVNGDIPRKITNKTAVALAERSPY